MLGHLDRLVPTTAHEPDCIRFYTQALGMRLETSSPAARHRWSARRLSSALRRSTGT
jgi:hypothetical protein